MSDRDGPTWVERWLVDSVVLQNVGNLSRQRERRTEAKSMMEIYMYIYIANLLSPSNVEKATEESSMERCRPTRLL